MLRDSAYLLDILISARKFIDYTSNISYMEFEASDLIQSAVERQFEIIGEASNRISSTTRQQYPELPWALMVGLRNRLAHDYRNIDVPTLWDTIHRDLPGLIGQIEPLVPPEEENNH